jgi:predicted nucleic acid-binding protein
VTGFCLDAGALIALERGNRWVDTAAKRALRDGLAVHVVPEVLAQVWRGGARQARLAAFLSSEDLVVPSYDAETARAVGQLAGLSGHPDVVDVHVVLHAMVHDLTVLTSDPDDLLAVHPSVRLVVV